MTTLAISQPEVIHPSRLTLLLRYLRRNKSLTIGLLIILLLTAFTVVGFLTLNLEDAYPLSVKAKQPPSAEFPFGTDFFGRDLLPAMVVGLWQTALIGLLAAASVTDAATSADPGCAR